VLKFNGSDISLKNWKFEISWFHMDNVMINQVSPLLLYLYELAKLNFFFSWTKHVI
jgi:hypothetical protein